MAMAQKPRSNLSDPWDWQVVTSLFPSGIRCYPGPPMGLGSSWDQGRDFTHSHLHFCMLERVPSLLDGT